MLPEPPSGSPALPPPPGRTTTAPPSGRARWGPSRFGTLLAVSLGVAAVATTAFALAFHLAGVGDAERSAHLPAPPVVTAPTPTPTPLSDVAAAALASVVTVEVDTARGERFGTGWLFDARGDIVTNNHVVERQLAMRIIDRAGGVHGAVLVGFDSVQDIAVVRMQGHLAGGPLPVDAATPPVGQKVAVLASARATDHTETTTETVARLHDAITINPDPGEPGATEIQYQDMTVLSGTPVFQGNSGGPVIDGRGDVLGIVTATSTSTAQSEAYAIPIGRVIAELRAFASRA